MRIATPDSAVTLAAAVSLVAVTLLQLSCAAAGGITVPTAAGAASDTFDVEIPPAEALLQVPLRAHPRLYLTAERGAALREQIQTDSLARSWYGQLKASADGYLTDGDVPRYEIPDGLRLLFMSRRVLERVATLGLVGRVENDPRYRERAWTELEAAAAFPDWNPRHFLDVGEMTTAFAIGYDWFHDQWTPAQRETIEQAIVQHGLKPALRAYRGEAPQGERWWTEADHNWNQVANGGVAIGALAVLNARPDIASKVLHESLSRLPLAMQHYAPDGAWNEGPGYWHYATFYNVLLLSALETAAGRDFGLAAIPGFSEAGWFPIYMTSPSGNSFAFADVPRDLGPTKGAELLWLARRFGEPAFAAHQIRHTQELNENRANPFNLAWYEPSLRGAALVDLPLDRHFRQTEVVSMRSSWNDPRAIFVGFKAGDNKANHSNLDLGTFLLDADGVRWATELGKDDYNLPGYWDRDGYDAERWTYYRMRAEGQNTLVINPDGRADHDPDAAAEIIDFESTPTYAHAVADLSEAYRDDATSVRRGIALLDGRREVLVQDEVRTARPSEVWWFMHTEAAVEIAPGGRSAVLTQNGQSMRVHLSGPADAVFVLMDAKPLRGTAVAAGQDANEGIRKLAVRLDAVTNVRMAVRFTPGGAEAAGAGVEIGGESTGQKVLQPLAEW